LPLKNIFPFPLSPAKLIGDYLTIGDAELTIPS
jgi:hypothetical protein